LALQSSNIYVTYHDVVICGIEPTMAHMHPPALLGKTFESTSTLWCPFDVIISCTKNNGLYGENIKLVFDLT
jgi:hypothetical protein